MEDDPLPTKVSDSFQQLKAAAAQLNAVSDELGKPISALDAALQRLNLGVVTWVEIAGNFDGNTGDYWAREIGYAKLGSKWGIALRTRSGNAQDPDDEYGESWLFNDAPRALRVEAVDKLPEFLAELVKAANKTADEIKGKIGSAQQVVSAIVPPRPTEQRK